eukprot:gene13636-biopygen9983
MGGEPKPVAAKVSFEVLHPETYGIESAEDVLRLYDGAGCLATQLKEITGFIGWVFTNPVIALLKDISRLKHPRLVNFIAVVTTRLFGIVVPKWQVMELCPDGDLKDLLKSRGGCLPLTEMWPQVEDIADGLAMLHSKGIVHRDMNVFLQTGPEKH